MPSKSNGTNKHRTYWFINQRTKLVTVVQEQITCQCGIGSILDISMEIHDYRRHIPDTWILETNEEVQVLLEQAHDKFSGKLELPRTKA